MTKGIVAAPAGSLVQPVTAASSAAHTSDGLYQAMLASCVLAQVDRPPGSLAYLSARRIRAIVAAGLAERSPDLLAQWQNEVDAGLRAPRWETATAAVRRVFSEWPGRARLPDFYAAEFRDIPAQHG